MDSGLLLISFIGLRPYVSLAVVASHSYYFDIEMYGYSQTFYFDFEMYGYIQTFCFCFFPFSSGFNRGLDINLTGSVNILGG